MLKFEKLTDGNIRVYAKDSNGNNTSRDFNNNEFTMLLRNSSSNGRTFNSFKFSTNNAGGW